MTERLSSVSHTTTLYVGGHHIKFENVPLNFHALRARVPLLGMVGRVPDGTVLIDCRTAILPRIKQRMELFVRIPPLSVGITGSILSSSREVGFTIPVVGYTTDLRQ